MQYDCFKILEHPLHHKDPFDRMIITQAITNKLVLMSDDSKFSQYSVKII